MSTYTIWGVEEVYDAFDDYEHANVLPPFCVEALSVNEAKQKGAELIYKYIRYNKIYSRDDYSSGTFAPTVIRIVDEVGNVVFDDSSSLVHGWPYPYDERGLVPDKLPTCPCFISYTRNNEHFAKMLYSQLSPSYLCWFAPERPDMPNGRPEDVQIIKESIMPGIHSARAVLVVISEHALSSSWVEFEVITALEEKRLHARPTIFGLQISPLTGDNLWLAELRAQKSIRDFSQWQNNTSFEQQIGSLMRELNSVYQSQQDIEAES